jgi:hypothetical protein
MQAVAIPDHPWVDAGEGAMVRIAMTVGGAGSREGVLWRVIEETDARDEAEGRLVTLAEKTGLVMADLTIGSNIAGAGQLRANDRLSSNGVLLAGAGFIVTPAEARELGLGVVPGLEACIHDYRNGRDLAASPRGVKVIDLFGFSEREVAERFPAVWQHLFDAVKPERDHNNRRSYREKWWLFAEARSELRPALSNISRYIATVETSKHRFFQFLDTSTRPDHMLIAIALDDAAHLAVLSSGVHVLWAVAAGGRLGYGNDPRYNKSRCFSTFPFPDPDEPTRARLRALGERLDAHRKRRQAAHPGLTLTQMYNVLEKLRANDPIEGRDRETYEDGLVGILLQLHDEIDAETARAYGWPAGISDDEILHRLVALNRERAAEEARGLVRWLRPEFQNPDGRAALPAAAAELDLGETAAAAGAKPDWPRLLPEQMAAVRAALNEAGEAAPADIARRFRRARATTVKPLLDTLTALGHARRLDDDRFAA